MSAPPLTARFVAPARRSASIVVFLAVLGMLVFSTTAVSAHGELAVASPGPGETVGRASHIDLIFTTEVFEWSVVVEGPDGEPIRGATVQKASSYLSFEAVPLDEEGQYIVRYSAVDTDGDLVEGAYAFSFEAGAPPPSELPDDLVVLQDDSGWPLWWYGGLLVVVLLIAVLAGLLAEKVRRLKANATG